MSLSADLLSQFVKATKTEQKESAETTVYGTVIYDGRPYVKIDGSDLLTPVSTTADVKDGERVTVLIKDHTATVTGNMSSPAARTDDVKEVGKQISEFEIVMAYKVTTEDLEATNATIQTLRAKLASIGKLEAVEADIETLSAKFADLEYVNANDITVITATIESLEAKFGTFTDISTEELEALNAEISNLRGYTADFTYVSADVLEAMKASIKEIDAKKLSAEDADIKYANIDFANIGKTAMEYFYAKSGLIKDVTVGDQTITGELVGVTFKGDLIEGNTIKADKLVVKGSDGLYYKLNFESGNFTGSEEVPTDSLHGSIITAQSITAEKVSVSDLVAFDATIGGFHITDTSLYSGVKESVNNTTQGIYLDSNGQVAIGDGTNYIKYFKDTDGKFKLAITAGAILLSTNDKNIEEAITNAQNTADEAKETADNALAKPELINNDTSFVEIRNALPDCIAGLKLYGKTVQNGTPTPENPVALESVGASGAIRTIVVGNNLLNYNEEQLLINTSGAVSSNRYVISAVVSVKSMDTVYLSGNFSLLNSSIVRTGLFDHYPTVGSVGAYTVVDNYKRRIDVSGYSYVLFSFSIYGMTSTADDIKNSFMCSTESDAQYEYPTAQIITASTPNGLPGIPVSSGGNYTDESSQQWICDEVDFARGIYVNRIGTKVLQSRSWVMSGTVDTNNWRFGMNIGVTTLDGAVLCDHFAFMTSIANGHAQGGGVTIYNGGYIEIVSPSHTTADAFIEWNENNPLAIMYVLAEPIETPLSAEELAQYAALYAIKPNTIIYNDANVEMHVELFDFATEGGVNRIVNAAIKVAGDSITSTVSKTYATKDALSDTDKKAEAAQSDIDNLNIGGRNLLLNTNGTGDIVIKGGTLATAGITQHANDGVLTLTCATESTEVYYRFMNPGVSTSDLYSLKAGETYVFSGKAMVTTTSGTLTDLAVRSQAYRLGGWTGGIKNTITADNAEDWVDFKYSFTVESDATGYYLSFQIYYEGSFAAVAKFKDLKLECGTRATDWTPAPEDVDSRISAVDKNAQDSIGELNADVSTVRSDISQLADSISHLITDSNGQSLMVQTSTGWTFSTAAIQSTVDEVSGSLDELVKKIGNTDAAIAILSDSVDEFGTIAGFVKVGEYTYTDEDGSIQTEPSIDLFETDTGFHLRITNTRIVFTDGATELLTINSKTKSLTTPKAIVEDELNLGKPTVAGKNLLANTKSLVGSNISGSGTVAAQGYEGFTVKKYDNSSSTGSSDVLQFTGIYPDNLGDVYTLSFYAKGSGSMITYFHGASGYLQVADVAQSTGAKGTSADGNSSWNLTSTWTRYWVTWTLKTSGNVSIQKYVLFRATAGSNVSVCGVKLEKGNKATTWTPAPEDADFAKMCGLWVWQSRSNGNLGLMWKGVTS